MICRKIYLWLVIFVVFSTAYAGKTEVDITGVSAFLAANQSVIVNRTEGGFLIGDSIDNNISTFSYMTPSGTVGKTICAFDLNGSHTINQLRFHKATADIDGVGSAVDYPNLEILVSLDTGALNTRSYFRVTGMINGDRDSELLTAVSFNSDGTIEQEYGSNSWFTITFDPVTVTAVAVAVERSVADDSIYVHYPFSEVQTFHKTGVLLQDLVHHWPLNDNLLDVVGGNNGTATGTVTFVENFHGASNSAISVTASDFVSSIDNLSIAGPAARTINFWFKSAQQLQAAVSYGRISNYGLFEVLLNYPTGGFAGHFGASNDTNNTGTGDQPVVSWNTWTMATMTYNGTDVKLYQNGVLKRTATLSLDTASTYMYIGGGNGSYYENYAGYIDDVKVWDIALTPVEVLEEYNWFMNTSLIHHWPLDGDLLDVAGGNNGTATGTVTFADGIDGTSNSAVSVTAADFISSTTALSLVGQVPRTINCWFKVDTAQDQSIFSYGERSLGGDLFEINFTSDRKIYGHFWGGGYETIAGTTRTFPLNQWVMATLVYDGTTVQVYQNGELINQKALSLATTSSPVYIGGGHGSGGASEYDQFSGQIDEIKIWDIALTPAKVLSEYNQFTNIVTINNIVNFASHWLDLDCTTWNIWCDGTDLNKSTVVDFSDYAIMVNSGAIGTENIEMITNGSFEDTVGNFPVGWDSDNNAQNGVDFTVTTDVGRTSTNCVKIDCTAYPDPGNVTSTSHALIYQQGITIHQGESYNLHFWAKAQNVEGQTARVAIFDTSDWIYAPLLENLDVSGDWQKYSFTINATQGIAADDFLLWFVLDEVGTLWLDDVTMTGPDIDNTPSFNPRVSSIGSKNLLRNSSFELGNDNWSSLGQGTGWIGDLSGLFGEIQTGNSWDGNHCLRIDMSPATYPITYADVWPASQVIQYSPLAANIGWARIEQGKDYVLSAYMKSDTPNVNAKLMFRYGGDPPSAANPWPAGEYGITTTSQTVTLSDQWQRYSFTSAASTDDLCIAVGPDMSSMPGSSAIYYIDAVQLEKSSSPTSYTPREQVEIGVSTEKYGNIFDVSESIQFKFAGRNTSANEKIVDVTIQLENYFGQLLPYDVLQMTIPGNGSTTMSWTVPVPGKGFYKAKISWQADGVSHLRNLKFAVIETYTGSDSPFGVNHAPSTSGQSDLLLKAGMTWARNWAQNWEWVEPVQGQVSYSSLDVHIDRVLDSGMNILSLLPSNPSTNWASEAPAEIPASGWLRLAYAPTNPQWLYDFIGQTVNRYKDREKYWEFLNEPLWVPDFCLPSSAGYIVSDYITLLQGASAAMKAADPTCKVVGGLAVSANDTLGDVFINAGGLNYVDIYNLHPYAVFEDPESFIAHMQRILTVMDNNGGRKPIWATECGYYAADDKPWSPYSGAPSWAGQLLLGNERLCSDYTIRWATIMLAHGVEKIFWHEPIEGAVNNGYLNMNSCFLAENAVPRKAYAAHSAMANMLGSAPVYAGKVTFPVSIFGSDINKLFCYSFQCGSRAVMVAWAYPGQVDGFSLTLAPGVEAFDIMGNPVSGFDSFGSSPVYITSTSMTAGNLANGWWQ